VTDTLQKPRHETVTADPRWKDLYRVGFFVNIAFPVAMFLAVIAYFIWPFTPGTTSIANIFTDLQNDRLGGLVKLDLTTPFLIGLLVFQLIPLYAALKRVNESYTLIALVLGLVGAALWFGSRPLVEMATLSDQYAAATTEAARTHYLAAGEALNTFFNGTNWMLSQFLIGFSYLISTILMLRSRIFSKATGYVGLVLAVTGFGFIIPAIGGVVAMVGTIGGIAWFVLMARDFYRLGWKNVSSPLATA
jgi:hypothetical protein